MSTIDQATADAIAVEAYVYLYPLVLMDVSRRQMTNVARVGDVALRGPEGAFVHARAFPSGDFRDVVRPNFDTLYSSAWIDLAQPQVLTVPPAEGNYYLLPMYDMWSEVFACPGTRTSDAPTSYALCGPGWEGTLPDDLVRIDAPTPKIWIIGRTSASPATFEQVHAFQNGLTLTPLSAWPGAALVPTGTVDSGVDGETPPLRQVFALGAADYFAYGAELLKLHPPHFNDGPQLQRLARIGIVPGESFDLAAADPVVRSAIEQAASKARDVIIARQQTLATPVDGWIVLADGMGAWGTNYLKRACVALIGLGANLPEDAIYPLSYLDADGDPYRGDHVLHFAADALPPVLGFWSLTLYDAEGFQVPNALERFAIGDRDALAYNDDGSLDIWIQAEEPAAGSSNWLPAPDGGWNVCLRLYHPKPEVLDGSWLPPAVAKA